MAYTDIDDPSAYFQTTLHTGNGSTQSVTNSGNSDLQPDLIWIKSRSEGEQHSWTDVIRGTDSQIHSEGTNAQSTATNSVTAFGSDGFSLGADGLVNKNNITYVSWNWKAGTAASGNTSGGTAKAFSSSSNATAGFSIVKYIGNDHVGHLIPHGCGAVPSMIIIRDYANTRAWTVYHKNTGNTHYLALNTTAAAADSDNVFNDTTPSSSVFTLADNSTVNNPSGTYIAYCFAEKQGYSKFGGYTGNGNADGPFIYTGFKPAFVMTKVTDAADSWTLRDNTRDTHNVVTSMLRADTNQAEDTSSSYLVDFLSNGFKWRSADGKQNGSGNAYIYMAFAENPFVTSTGIPATAR